MTGYKQLARYLALSLKDGWWNQTALVNRIERSLVDFADTEQLAARLIFNFDTGLSPPYEVLVDFLSNDSLVRKYFESDNNLRNPKIVLDSPVMGSLPQGMITFPLPNLATWRDICLWLGLHHDELAWFADREGRQRNINESRLHHYHYRWIPKQSGDSRLLEIPKTRLKSIQRQILREILNKIPPHPSNHGFTRGRSSLTYVRQHLGKDVVLHMDLKNFFHSVPSARIGATFRRLGYPQTIARLLQGLCTHATSAELAGSDYQKLPWRRQKSLACKHLPQGAPTSPAIANLCAWKLDCRLSGLADRFGLEYSRYADDLAFSSSRKLLSLAPFLQGLIGAITLDEGFEINHRKTRIQTQAQSQHLGGVVINQKPNLPRREFERLKAILYNCLRWGPESQNREQVDDFRAHLAGRIAYATWLNPDKSERLKRLWRQIHWPE